MKIKFSTIIIALTFSTQMQAQNTTLNFKFNECILIVLDNRTGKLKNEKHSIPDSYNCTKINSDQFHCSIRFKDQNNVNSVVLNYFENSKTKLISENKRDFINFSENFVYLRSTFADKGEKICTGNKL